MRRRLRRYLKPGQVQATRSPSTVTVSCNPVSRGLRSTGAWRARLHLLSQSAVPPFGARQKGGDRGQKKRSGERVHAAVAWRSPCAARQVLGDSLNPDDYRIVDLSPPRAAIRLSSHSPDATDTTGSVSPAPLSAMPAMLPLPLFWFDADLPVAHVATRCTVGAGLDIRADPPRPISDLGSTGSRVSVSRAQRAAGWGGLPCRTLRPARSTRSARTDVAKHTSGARDTGLPLRAPGSALAGRGARRRRPDRQDEGEDRYGNEVPHLDLLVHW
jgi:hypothetical protein